MEQSYPWPSRDQGWGPGSWQGKEILDLQRGPGEEGVGGWGDATSDGRASSVLPFLPKRGDTGPLDSKASCFGWMG